MGFNVCKKIWILMVLSMLVMPAQAEEPDWSNYAGLLSDHVSLGEKNNIQLNLVDYQAWAKDKRWKKVLTTIKKFNIDSLQGKEEIAFWINVYNILAIKMVLDHQPDESIRDIGSFFSPVWKKDAGMVAGQMRTLHEIEHEILRPMGEPRIHFAIVCASVSCPDLLADVYRAKTLQMQLQRQAEKFVANRGKGVLKQGEEMFVSHIFDWFEDDFEYVGGVQVWLLALSDPIKGNVSGYLPYDWSLNAR